MEASDLPAYFRQQQREQEASPDWVPATAFSSSKAASRVTAPALPAPTPATSTSSADPPISSEAPGHASHDQVLRLLQSQVVDDPLLSSQIEVVATLCGLQLGTSVTASSTVCPICQESLEVGQPLAITQCFHFYHAQCLAQSRARSFNLEGFCHVCRSPLSLNSVAGL
jgi:hypothetical protein